MPLITNCSGSYVIWPVLTQSPLLPSTSFSSCIQEGPFWSFGVFLLQCPFAYSFPSLYNDAFQICSWLAPSHSHVTWNVTSSRDCLRPLWYLPSSHYFLHHNSTNLLLWRIILCWVDLFHRMFIACLYPGMWSVLVTQTLQSYLPLCFQCQKDGLKQRRCNAYLMNEWIYEFMKPYHVWGIYWLSLSSLYTSLIGYIPFYVALVGT